jgi:hypothetical protein
MRMPLRGGPRLRQGGPGRAVPGALACGAGWARVQAHQAEGRAARQDASEGAHRERRPPAGRQPAPDNHGAGGVGAWGTAAAGASPTSAPDPRSLRQRVGAGVLAATRGGPCACADRDSPSPRGDPAGPLRAARVQATPQAVSPPEGTAAASPRTLGTSRLSLRKRHSTIIRLNTCGTRRRSGRLMTSTSRNLLR